jgi:hypothetical protein
LFEDALDLEQLFAVHFVGVDPEHPVGRRQPLAQRRERIVAHRREVDEAPLDHEQPVFGREGAGFDRRDVGAAGTGGIVVDDEKIDDPLDRGERRLQIRLIRVADAQSTSYHQISSS